MTSVGRRPTLDELLDALFAIDSIEANADAIDPRKETFCIILTFLRQGGPADWIEGQPKPRWLFEQILEELTAWKWQREREEQWVSKEERMYSSIDTLMAHYLEELKKARAAAPQTLATRMQEAFYSDTILRLKELKERREAGGVYSHTESRREKARKSWMEDEYEAPKREEAQRRQQAKWDWADGPDQTSYTYQYDGDGIDPELLRKFWEGIHGAKNKNPHKPQSGNRRPWYEILGVPPNATKAQITKAYRKLVAKYQPRTSKDAEDAERTKKMTEINTARDEGLSRL